LKDRSDDDHRLIRIFRSILRHRATRTIGGSAAQSAQITQPTM
jgi:hypothetical protein